MTFEFEKTAVEGVILIKPKVFGDERGFFLETYKKDDFEKEGIIGDFVQDNHSKSKGGVIRGLHFQKGKYAQAKLVRCIKGKLFDVAVDIRKESPTYGKYFAVTLSEENKHCLYIPRGCAHGFATLSDEVEMEYKNDNLYSFENEGGLIWNDPEINIPWPIKNPILSEKDKNWPKLKELN
ncbi:dTDP-4-dehydrorhamnose 3,5-epimerase [Candidatus Pacearchaeota archaeon CG10_big_fil_rev_8_21_14_0_10_30_48]|nr:MAG: dTDP-4-dehydrorhamnose 3,5-epimerase [Candidatus Pacearchaeota archaeon CG10_big_fil_rev_8_21_14_0_10_30_48]